MRKRRSTLAALVSAIAIGLSSCAPAAYAEVRHEDGSITLSATDVAAVEHVLDTLVKEIERLKSQLDKSCS